MLSLFVLLYVLIIAIFKTIVFFICAISVFFDNMLNKIKSNQIKPETIHCTSVSIDSFKFLFTAPFSFID